MINRLAGSSAIQTRQELLFTLDFFSFRGGRGGGGDEDDKCISKKFRNTKKEMVFILEPLGLLPIF